MSTLSFPSWFCCLHSPSSLPGSDVYTLLPFLVLLSTLSSSPSSLSDSSLYTHLLHSPSHCSCFFPLYSSLSTFPPPSLNNLPTTALLHFPQYSSSSFSKAFNKSTKRTDLFLEGWVRTGYSELSRGKATSNQRKT